MPNNLPGPGDLPVPDPEPEIPEWAMDEAQCEIMTNDRCFDFVMENCYDQFRRLWRTEIDAEALKIIERLRIAND